jgi:hypothetical protein
MQVTTVFPIFTSNLLKKNVILRKAKIFKQARAIAFKENMGSVGPIEEYQISLWIQKFFGTAILKD